MRPRRTRPASPPRLDVYVHNLLSMKRFHEALAGNVHECLLKLSIGKIRIYREGRGSQAFANTQ
jgi:hypothetical protein